MTNGTIKVYSNIPLTEQRNFLIEEMEKFLSDKSPTIINGVFVKTADNDLTIKLPLSGTTALSTYRPNYLSYQVGNSIWYYFIRSCSWVANSTLLVSLHIDALNTFGASIEAALTDRTMTIREHRDRFLSKSLSYASMTPNTEVTSKVDNIAEGLLPLKLKTSRDSIELTTENLRGQWYLVYKTKNELSTTDIVNPVSAFLYCDKNILYRKGGTNSAVVWQTSQLPEYPDFLAFAFAANPNLSINAFGAPILATSAHYGVAFYNKDGCSYAVWCDPTDNGKILQDVIIRVTSPSSLTINIANGYNTISENKTYDLIDFDDILSNATYSYLGIGGAVDAYYGNAIDLADSRLVKVINLPYAPIDFSTNARGEYYFPYWQMDYYADILKAKDLTREFLQKALTTHSLDDIATYKPFSSFDEHMTASILEGLAKGTIKDPKLYNSDLYTIKITYDSFSYDFKAENMEFNQDTLHYLEFAFKATNTINSNMLFSPAIYGTSYRSENDYDILVSSRNNEVPLFTNNYVDYIRSGFNYDKKAKAVESESRWLGFAISTIGSAGAALTGGPVGAAAAIGGAATAIGQLVSAISGQAQSDNDMASKLAQLKLQSTTISACDDQDLLRYYNGNRLIVERFEPRENIKSMLSSLFYYYGYATNRQKIPNLNNRHWFNFIQCSPDFDFSELSPTFQNVIEEVTQKLKDGVTIFHYHNGYDLAQSKENWETWIIDHG